MRRLLTTAVAAAAMTISGAVPAAAEVTIEVQDPYGVLFNTTHEVIAEAFKKERPDVTVKFRAPYESYEDGSQKVLKEAITKQLPDVTFQGLNRQRILVEKGIAVSLEPFIAKEPDFSKEGYHKAMLDLGTFEDEVHGLPFAISLPIGYYNMDILEQAGWNKPLPSTWDEVIELCGMIKAKVPDVDTMFWGWNITGNWFWQALNWSRDNPMLDGAESKVNFGNDAGQWSMDTFARLIEGCDMPNYSVKEAVGPFSAGSMGMFFWSTSRLAKFTQEIGDKFTMKTGPFPDVAEGGGLPAGGNAAMMLATEPVKQEAAWDFIKFATSGRGAAVVAETTGYMPPNKKANEVFLKDFYDKHPNNLAAVKQLPLLRTWYAFPGKNGLKITKVIFDSMQSVVSRDRLGEPDQVLEDMVGDVQKLLPKPAS